MRKIIFKAAGIILLLAAITPNLYSQTKPLSGKMAATVMDIWKDSLSTQPGRPVKWTYELGVVLEGFAGIWKRTGDKRYFDYIKKSMDYFVQPAGTIRTYPPEDYNLDNIKPGRSLLLLYNATGEDKYLKAATLLYNQLQKQPKTSDGGFWHKKIYPSQMWLDGLYMSGPFYTEYASTFLPHHPEVFDDIAKQFILMERHSRDDQTGLLYHGWDESRKERWADKSSGRSPNFWGRAMGWYGMALVDVLENFPASHPKRDSIMAILTRFASAVEKVQDKKTGLWYQVLDKPQGKGNYLEASASNMFVYALAKGVRLGYLPQKYMQIAQKGYKGIKKEFVEAVHSDAVNLKGTVSVAGLGGNPYRDGSYEYYLSEKVITNDPKGVGAFLMASNEMEIAAMSKLPAKK